MAATVTDYQAIETENCIYGYINPQLVPSEVGIVIGFDFESRWAEVLVLISVLTQTWIKYWFWFRVGFDFDPGLVGYHGRNQTGHKGTMSTISFFLILEYILKPKIVYFPFNFHSW